MCKVLLLHMFWPVWLLLFLFVFPVGFLYYTRIWKRECLNLQVVGKLELKMAEFKNHRRFTLRYLSKGLVRVSIKLKTTVKTIKGIYIVRKAERMLMNERIRSINNTITMLNCQIYTCMNILGGMIYREVIEECYEFINYIRERRHSKTMERQKKKFERLWQINTGGHPNIQNGRDGYNQEENGTEVTSSEDPETTTTLGETTTAAVNNHKVKWVHNLSKTPLTGMQEKALAHGPNFAVVAREPPVGKYISQIETREGGRTQS